MKKLFALILTAAMALSALAGCGGSGNSSDLAYVRDKGTMTVGITEYAPMDYRDENGEWAGFDAEFARLVAEELGVEAEFVILSDWGQRYYELQTKNIDVIWNGLTITEEVRLNTNVTNPYVTNAQVVVMKADRIGEYADEESLLGLSFAVESGSAGEEAVEELGIEHVVALQDQTSAVMEVAAGTADACVVDITMAGAMTGEGTGYPDLAQGLKLRQEEYGIGFRKDSDLTAKVNEIMSSLAADGTLQALADKYGLTLADIQ